MSTALIVQGSWHHRWTEKFEDYCTQFDQIVVSCYKNDAVKMCAYPHILNHPQVSVVLNHNSLPDGADWYGNVWFQCLTTRAALQQVRTDHVIKTRTDEYFSNLNLMRNRIEASGLNCCINIYFKRACWFPFHIGDHLYGGRTDLFRRGFDILESHLKVDRFRNSSHAAEQKICLSLLEAEGRVPNWTQSGQQMLQSWTVFDAKLLEPFWFNAPSVGTVGSTVEEVAQCEANNITVDIFDSIDKYFD